MTIFYRFLLAWIRLDLRIARSAPVMNIRLLEQLRREEERYEGLIIRSRMNLYSASL